MIGDGRWEEDAGDNDEELPDDVAFLLRDGVGEGSTLGLRDSAVDGFGLAIPVLGLSVDIALDALGRLDERRLLVPDHCWLSGISCCIPNRSCA